MSLLPPRAKTAEAVRGAVSTYPGPGREVVAETLEGRAAIPSAVLRKLASESGRTVTEIMVDLLPVAEAYAAPEISGFSVGAVARCETEGGEALYLGANLEVSGVSLGATVHAEQAAVASAWSDGATRIHSLTVTSPPCGYCRQFLTEFVRENEIMTVIVAESGSPRTTSLNELLPHNFGPADLGVESGPFDARRSGVVELVPVAGEGGGRSSGGVREGEIDSLIRSAIEAARASYAPYSENRAGLALGLEDGGTVSGAYLENAAFNPSLSPVQVAMVMAQLGRPLDSPMAIRRAVLAETDAACSQEPIVSAVLGVAEPAVDLECYELRARSTS